MSLEQAIQRRWAAYRPLERWVPVERVFTGNAHDNPRVPYAVVTRQHDRPVVHTSSGTSVREVTVRIQIWVATLGEGKKIVSRLGKAFSLFDPRKLDADILVIRRGEQDEQLNEDGSWRMRVDLIVRVWIRDASREREIYFKVVEMCKLGLDAAGIEIPFPHLQLFWDDVDDRVMKKIAAVAGGPAGGSSTT